MPDLPNPDLPNPAGALPSWSESPEKQKMDYQAQLESERITCCRGSRWLEIFWDKFLFAIAVAVLAAAAVGGINCISESRRQTEARGLEEYKLNEARKRFFMEKRLEALTNVTSAMSAVTKVYFGNTLGPKVPNPEEADRQYKLALENAREVLNRAEPLFDEDFNKDMTWYYELHRAISRAGIEPSIKYRDFLADIERQVGRLFESMLKNLETKGEIGKIDSSLRLTLAPITYSERIRLTPEEYIRCHYLFWSEWNANAKK